MLTILLKILSILGILLLVLLGVALVAVLLILFFPVTYKASGKKTATEWQIMAKAGWLFGFFRIIYRYPDPGKLIAKCLFFTVYDSSAEKKSNPPKDRKSASEKQASAKQDGAEASSKEQATLEQSEESLHAQNDPEGTHTANTNTAIDSDKSRKQATDADFEKKSGIVERLFEKIRYKVNTVCDKIKNILRNISFYRQLWDDPDTQGLLKHAGKRFFHIWKRLRPRRLKINAVCGTGSPDTTGYLYGIYGMLLPKLGPGINISPDFEQAVLEGEFQLSGHFNLASVLFHLGRLLLDKRLRRLLYEIKHFKKTQKKE